VQNTNLPEVFNKVLKGIRAMPVSAIVEYTFYKINSYFVHRWKKARDHIDRGLHGVNTFGKCRDSLPPAVNLCQSCVGLSDG
jgi:hypothetical protein